MKNWLFIFIFFSLKGFTQEHLNYKIFENEPINFGGIVGVDHEVVRLQNGRVIYKKVNVPKFPKGTDATIKLTLRSNGDRWDKSGSCFVITNPEEISIIDVSKGDKKFPVDASLGNKFGGIRASKNYKPVVELLRFMTPFGVGHYSNDTISHRKPVYIPKWEKEVVWEQDISELASIVSGSFYVGVWIDSWTKEGYSVDLSISYSNRKRIVQEVIPLINTIAYVEGQSLPDFFAESPLDCKFQLDKDAKNVKLHYITTGHGGHSGGDEFIKIKNSVYFENKLVLDTIPWRDDCASFRRFNPTSGVWLKKDTASYIDFKEGTYKEKEIEERIASSDLSRSNWCPGSRVDPMVVEIGDLKQGTYNVKVVIPATPAEADKLNHWLVSAYLTFER